MRIREKKQSGHAEAPCAGKRRGLHCSENGVRIPKKFERSYDADTHDYSHVFGWNLHRKK